MRHPFLPVALGLIAWALATLNLLLAVYLWRHAKG